MTWPWPDPTDRRIRELEAENAELERKLAEAEALAKKWTAEANELEDDYELEEGRKGGLFDCAAELTETLATAQGEKGVG